MNNTNHKIIQIVIIFITLFIHTLKAESHNISNNGNTLKVKKNFMNSYNHAEEIFSGVIEESISISPIDQILIIRVYDFFKTNQPNISFKRYILINAKEKRKFLNNMEYLFYVHSISKYISIPAKFHRTNLLHKAHYDLKIFTTIFAKDRINKNNVNNPPSKASDFHGITSFFQSIKNFFVKIGHFIKYNIF